MSTNENNSNASVKLAVAMALFRSKLLPRHANNSLPPSAAVADEVKALRWKRKAKERKQELLRLKEDLKEAEDTLQHDLFPQTASCKCYFLDDIGISSSKQFRDGFNHRYSDVLRRRFLRQVRLKARKKRKADGSTQRSHYPADFNSEGETEQLRASVDFLVELCDTVSSVVEPSFANWSHQAVDFILASVKNMLQMEKNEEAVDQIISSLIMRLVRRMCHPLHGNVSDSHQTDAEPQLYVQHVIRKLGSEPYVGLRAMLSVSQRISTIAESLLFLDPFDGAFANMHTSMFIMTQLIEFLVSDYLPAWSKNDGFDSMLFEEWVASVIHARKALELLENRHGLYVLYLDRVIGELAKQQGHVPSFQNLNPDILDNLLC